MSQEEQKAASELNAPVRHVGRAACRIKQNPLEGEFAEAWREEQKGGLLEYLMGDGTHRGAVTERDEMVAATVIQWLGSPVGQCFLRDVKERA